MSFWSLGSQESIASNGPWFGFETKKLWPFEDNYAKLNGSGAAAANFTTVRHVLEHFLELKLFILYIILKLRKSGIQCFKRCMIWIWNEEVMAIWRQTTQSWAGISHLEIQSAKNPFQGAKISHLEIQNAEMTNYLLNPFLNTQDSVFHS